VRTNVYVDGFNLYYGCLKGSPFKWLDLVSFCRRLLPPEKNQLQRIRYFTAKVRARAGRPQGPVRQSAYLRALGTLPQVTVHLGHFLASTTRMPLAMRVVRHDLGYVVGILNPHPPRKRSRALLECSPTFFKQIRASALRTSQLPDRIYDEANRVIHKPAGW